MRCEKSWLNIGKVPRKLWLKIVGCGEHRNWKFQRCRKWQWRLLGCGEKHNEDCHVLQKKNEKNGVERFYIAGNEMVWLSFAQSKISYDKLLVRKWQ